MALVGNLRDIKLPNLIQLNCMEKNTAKLTIDHAGKFGFIYFRGGQVVHAEFDPEIGEEAFYRLLALHDGQFKVESGIRPPVVSIKTNWNNLLLEGLHKIDSSDSGESSDESSKINIVQNIKGVLNSAVFDREGRIISGKENLKTKAVLSAFTIMQIDFIHDLIREEELEFVSLTDQDQRTLLTKKGNNIIYIAIDSKQQIEMILPYIKKALK